MKKKLLTALLVITVTAMAGCGMNQKDLSLYADDASKMAQATESREATDGSNEGQQGEESAEVAKSEQAPVDPDDVLKYGRDTYLQESKEPNGSSESSAESKTEEPKESAKPTAEPTVKPTAEPTATPKPEKTAKPQETAKPAETTQPTVAPTQTPTVASTQAPVQTQAPAQTSQPAQPDPKEICAAQGHDYDEGYVWRAPTCTIPGEKCQTCRRCGSPRYVPIEKTAHDMEVVYQLPGDCVTAAHTRLKCKNCDHTEDQYDNSCIGRDHVFTTGTYQEFDEDLLEWVDVTVTSCGKCGYEIERTRSK